jgi:hypothetical protein
MSEKNEKLKKEFELRRARAVIEYIPEQDKYSDAIVVSNKPGMFQINFGQYLPRANIRFHTRIWTDPVAFKSFIKVFQSQLEVYEKLHGAIPDIEITADVFRALNEEQK